MTVFFFINLANMPLYTVYTLSRAFYMNTVHFQNTKCLNWYILVQLLQWRGDTTASKVSDVECYDTTYSSYHTIHLDTWLAIKRQMCGQSHLAQMCLTVFTGAMSIPYIFSLKTVFSPSDSKTGKAKKRSQDNVRGLNTLKSS